jgi:hypothetical protein
MAAAFYVIAIDFFNPSLHFKIDKLGDLYGAYPTLAWAALGAERR